VFDSFRHANIHIAQVSIRPLEFAKGMTTSSPEVPVWVRSLAFSSLSGKEIGRQTYTFKASGRSELRGAAYDILEELQSGATIRIERYNDGRKPALMAATYILVALEDGEDSGDLLNHLTEMLLEPKPLLWVEKCTGFEQMIAIHFEPRDFTNLDLLLSSSSQLYLKSSVDYLNVVNEDVGEIKDTSGSQTIPNVVAESTLTSVNLMLPSNLAIIDTPISKGHEYLRGCEIYQSDCFITDGDCEHGTFVAGVVKQINSIVHMYSFPVMEVVVLVDVNRRSSYKDDEIYYGSRGMQLSGIGRVAAALAAFLNSDCKVANFSFGVANTSNEAIAFLTPLMKKLRSKGSILVVASGNGDSNHVGIDIDSGVTDLFAYFINFEFIGEDNRPYVMDNIVFVAAVKRAGQLASFSNYGHSTVLLAAPGVGIHSCSPIPPNSYKKNNGTSFAAPQVAVTLAMMAVRFPLETHTQIIQRLRQSVDPDDTLEMTTISGGRLNIGRALGD